MTDRPMIFSAPMVRAILREIDAPGTGKTQTRRVLKLPVKGGWAISFTPRLGNIDSEGV